MNYGSFGYDGGGAASGSGYQGSGSYDYGGGGGQSGGEAQRPSNFRPGDWMCSCGAHNYAYRATCNKCSNPKPDGGGGGYRGRDRDYGGGGGGYGRGRGRDYSRSRSRDRFEGRERRRDSRSRSRSRDRGGYGGGGGGGYGGSGGGFGRPQRTCKHILPQRRIYTCFLSATWEVVFSFYLTYFFRRLLNLLLSLSPLSLCYVISPLELKPIGSNVCYAYQKGDCKFGATCRFEHVYEEGGDRRGGGYRDDGRGGGGFRDRPRRSNVCYAWKNNECDKGDSCRFDHFEDRSSGGGGFDRGGDRDGRGPPRREKGPRNKLRSGDWWCPICQIHKFGFRDDCEKCGSKKTEDAVAEVDKIIQKNEEAGLPESFRPGDWMCPKCKDHIFAKHDTCTKCDNKTMKPTDGSAWGLFVDPSAANADTDRGNEEDKSGADDKADAKEDDEQPVVAEAA